MTVSLPILTTNPSHTIFSPRRKAAFLTQLAQSGNVRLACRAAGISPQTAYRARRASPALEQAWDAALLAARPIAEQVLADRALNGVEEPVFYHGEEVARRTRFDARLLLAHIGRLDALAAEPEMDAAVRNLDDHIATLESGEELAEPIDHDAPWYGDEEDELDEDELDEDELDEDELDEDMDWRNAHSGAQGEGVDSSWAPASAGAHDAGAHDAGGEGGWTPASAAAHEEHHNPVPGVPSCRENPPSTSAAVGQTETPPEDKGSFLQPWPTYDPAEEGESPCVSRREAEEGEPPSTSAAIGQKETQSPPASPAGPVAGSILRL